jgi:hypothetical protein
MTPVAVATAMPPTVTAMEASTMVETAAMESAAVEPSTAATPAVEAFSAAPAKAAPKRISAPVPARSMPAVGIKAIVTAAEEILRVFHGQAFSRDRSEIAHWDRRGGSFLNGRAKAREKGGDHRYFCKNWTHFHSCARIFPRVGPKAAKSCDRPSRIIERCFKKPMKQGQEFS